VKLYELSWSIYPRRVGIYLTEKGMDTHEAIERIEAALPQDMSQRILASVTHAGTVPALDTGDGLTIGSSLAIMEYLEDRFPTPTMLGDTATERARTREFTFVADEAAVHMGVWVHNASRLFTGREPQNADVAQAGMKAYHAKLRLIETMASERNGAFLTGDKVTIADCVTYSMLQTGKEFFGAPIPKDCAFLIAWYDRFSKRPSGAVPNFPPVLHITQGLPEQTLNPGA
jgi:glutathione S-transferase